MPLITPETEPEESFGSSVGEASQSEPTLSPLDEFAQQETFDDATPDYVQKQPGQPTEAAKPIDPNRVTGPDTTQPASRQTTEQVSGRVAPGQPLPNPANRERSLSDLVRRQKGSGSDKADGAAIQAASGGSFKDKALGWATGKLKGKAKEPAGTVGKAKEVVTKDAADVSKLVATGGADVGSWVSLARKHWKALVALALVITLPLIFFGFALGSLLTRQGDPQGTVGLGANSVYGADGVYCKEMSPTKASSITPGKNLFLQTSKAKFKYEEPAHAPGIINDNAETDAGEPLSTALQERFDGIVGYTTEELKYYLNMRWAYVQAKWSGVTKSLTKGTGYSAKDIAGRHIMVYNPATKQAAVGIAAEYGPAAWAGAGYSSANNRYPSSSKYFIDPDQKALWGPTTARVTDPTDFQGRTLGAPKTLAALIGNPEDKQVIIGFVPDTTPLGAAKCTEYQLAGTGGGGAGSTVQPLKVPGIKEGAKRQCVTASHISIVRYYNPGFKGTWNGTKYYDPASNSTVPQTNCSTEDFLNSNTSGKATDFVSANSTRAEQPKAAHTATIEQVKASLLGGDPVIARVGAGGIYSNSFHTFVLTGWDESTKTFWAMNPSPGAYEENTQTPNGKRMTEEHFMRFVGDGPKGENSYDNYAFRIRAKYLK